MRDEEACRRERMENLEELRWNREERRKAKEAR